MLRILKYQPGDADGLPVVLAFGDVAGVRLTGGFVAFDVVSGDHRLGESFPSKLMERQNQWSTYSAESGIDERAFSYATTITAIAGRTVTVANIGVAYEGYYNLGQLKFGAGAAAERVFVNYHVGTVFYPVGKLPTGVAVGHPVTLIAGDDKMLATARDKFGPIAVDRFLGFDLLPTTDPFQTGITQATVYRAPYPTVPPAPTPTPVTGLPFNFFPTLAETDTDATVSILVNDPDNRLVSVEYRTNATGFPASWTAWSAAAFSASPPTYVATGAKGAGGYVDIEMRITYLDDASVSHTVTSAYEFVRPFYYPVPTIDVSGTLTVEPIGVAGSGWLRTFVTLTGDKDIRVSMGYGNQHARLFFDATGGPYTLTLATTNAAGEPITNYLNSAPVASFVVDDYAVLEVNRLFDGNLDWTVIAHGAGFGPGPGDPATHYAISAPVAVLSFGQTVTVTARRKTALNANETTAGVSGTWSDSGVTDGNFSPSSSTTNSSGIATTNFTAGSTPGAVTITFLDGAGLTGSVTLSVAASDPIPTGPDIIATTNFNDGTTNPFWIGGSSPDITVVDDTTGSGRAKVLRVHLALDHFPQDVNRYIGVGQLGPGDRIGLGQSLYFKGDFYLPTGITTSPFMQRKMIYWQHLAFPGSFWSIVTLYGAELKWTNGRDFGERMSAVLNGGVPLTLGRWYTLETGITLNTSFTSSDGHGSLWLDGVLQDSFSGFSWSDPRWGSPPFSYNPANQAFDNLSIGQQLACETFTSDEFRYWDNVTLSRVRVP
jgi:hypothetical protein